MKFNNIKLVLILSILLSAYGSNANAVGPPISVNVDQVYYHLGGGEALPRPASGFTSFNIRARFTAGFGYSCGKFNYHDNIQQMVNQLKTKVRAIPSQLQTAVSAGIAGLPGYLMQKYNPTLYNILTQTLDQSADLFQLSYKSCQQMEAEMASNPDANPYSGFLRASIANKWSDGAKSGDKNAADTNEDIKANPAGPIEWLGGKLYGTSDNPVQINKDIVTAGYNILIGRTNDVSLTTEPPESMRDEPIVKIWKNPNLAGRWIQDVIGDKRIILDESIEPDTIPGKGLRPKVIILENEIRTALLDAYENNEYEDLNKYTTVRISGSIINGLRSLPQGERLIMMDRLISEMAVSEIQERMFLIKQMISAGLNAPDVSASLGGSTADEHIRHVSLPEIDSKINEIYDDLELKQRTINRTTIAILNRAEQYKNSGIGTQPGSAIRENDFLNN